MMIGDTGIAGKTEAIEGMTKIPCEIKSYELSDFKVTFLNAGAALLTYKGAADGTCAGTATPAAWCSSVYVNRGGRWLVAAHQETPITAPK
jgi:hypothetical protein